MERPRRHLFVLAWLIGFSACCASAQSLNGGHVPCRQADEGKQELVPLNGGTTVSCTCEQQKLIKCKLVRSKECDDSLKGCHFVENSKTGFCPKICRSCVANGTQHQSGETWASPDDNCLVHECFSGIVTSSRIQCPTPLCSNPSAEVGKCCPSCPVCKRGSQVFGEGETVADKLDPCTECSCIQGRLACQRKACPVLACPEHLHKVTKGQCCPVCARQHESSRAFSRMCRFQGKVYNIGSSVKPDSCTTCTCHSSLGMQCYRKTCPPQPCAKGSLLPPTPSQCCPVCVGEKEPDASKSKSELAATRPSSCLHKNLLHNDGDTWTESCTECVCSKGELKCKRLSCPEVKCSRGYEVQQQAGDCCPRCYQKEGICTVFGDPHYQTFDGRVFNFQGSCKYLLASDRQPEEMWSEGRNSSFSIRITNDARDSYAFSWLRTVTVRFHGHKISLLQKMKVKVDGRRETLPYIKLGHFSIMKDGYHIILNTNTGIRILWDGVSYLELSVGLQYRGKMCGLCGNFNGDAADDLHTRNGQLTTNGKDFGETWRIGGLQACSVLPRDMPHSYEPQCKQTWQAKINSDRYCNALNSTLFTACHAVVSPLFYYNACKLDMCECPGDQCHCEVLTAYARECERMGALRSKDVDNWRQYTGCVNVTSFKWKSNNGALQMTNRSASDVKMALEVKRELESSLDYGYATDSGLRKGEERKPSLLGEILPGCSPKNAEFCREHLQSGERQGQSKAKQRRQRRKMRRIKKRLMRQRRKKTKTRRGRKIQLSQRNNKKQKSSSRQSSEEDKKKKPPFEFLLSAREESSHRSRQRSHDRNYTRPPTEGEPAAVGESDDSFTSMSPEDIAALMSKRKPLSPSQVSARTPLPLLEDRELWDRSEEQAMRDSRWRRKRRGGSQRRHPK